MSIIMAVSSKAVRQLNPTAARRKVRQLSGSIEWHQPTTWLLAAPIRIRWAGSRFRLGQALSGEGEVGEVTGRVGQLRTPWSETQPAP
jgi:hypothetical protein